MTGVSTTCAVVIFRVNVSCIMSVDGIKLWLFGQLSRDIIGQLLSRDVITSRLIDQSGQ